MLGFYFLVLVLVCMIAYAGIENTMNVFAYLDVQMRYRMIRIKTYPMLRKLEKDLGIPPTSFMKHVFPEEVSNK